jgi:phosphatidylserine decarboxylase
MSAVRATLLSLLPKVALSRLTGLLARLPLPAPLRAPLYGWYARRYGADLGEIEGSLREFRCLQQFFQRPLRQGLRPVADSALVWPCDGRVVTAGPVAGGRVPQVKGIDYALLDLLGDAELAAALADGSQATVYLAPGDYHRVHAPFAALVEEVRALPGTLFPVNPPAVRCIPRLFVRNARHVLRCRLGDGRPAAVVLVGAFNVGGTTIAVRGGQRVAAGDEIGRFGFGSTVVAVVAAGAPAFAVVAPETRVRVGGAALAQQVQRATTN